MRNNCEKNDKTYEIKELGIGVKWKAYNVKISFQGIFLKEYIEERVMLIARYIIENNATVRQAAKYFGISKSTVHKDTTERLECLNPALALEARKVLNHRF